MRKIIFLVQLLFFLAISSVYAKKIENIIVTGNERISTETIIIFGDINLNEDLDENTFKKILLDIKNNTQIKKGSQIGRQASHPKRI